MSYEQKDKESLTCQDCGVSSKDAVETTCPYAEEIAGVVEHVVVCDSCYETRERDI